MAATCEWADRLFLSLDGEKLIAAQCQNEATYELVENPEYRLCGDHATAVLQLGVPVRRRA